MGEREWRNPAPAAGDRIEAKGLMVKCLPPGGAALISGDLQAAIAALAPGAVMIGLLDEMPGQGGFALRIARDRALLCTVQPLDAAPGWQGGYALSPADDLHTSIEITGDAEGMFLRSCLSARAGSPSAMTLFAEKPCLVARRAGAVRVWVPAPDMAEVWSRLALLARG